MRCFLSRKKPSIRVNSHRDGTWAKMKIGNWSRLLLIAAAFCYLAGAFATIVDVVLRATVNSHLPNVIEVTTLTVGAGALISIPVCFLNGTHVTARFLSELKPDLLLKPLGYINVLFACVFTVVMALVTGLHAFEKWGGPERTADLQLSLDNFLMIVFLIFCGSVIAALARLKHTLFGKPSDG